MSASTMPGPQPIRKILIFRALQLGDMLNAVPALRALRAAHPEARITLMGLPWATQFVDRFHSYLDNFVTFPGFPGLPEQQPDLAGLPSFLERMHSTGYDLAIQMHGSGDIANPFISLCGAKQIAGFYLQGHYCPDPNWFLEYPEQEPEVWRNLHLMEHLGIPLQGDELEFPLYEDDWNSFRRLEKDFGLREPYICIQPGARKSERRWPASHFAALADGLAAQGYQVVLTGSRDEAELTATVRSRMQADAVDLGGWTDLGTLGALLSRSHLLVCNDAGVSHIASALKTPSVVLFAVPDLYRWAPRDRHLRRTLPHSLERRPEDVLAQTEEHLKEVYAHVH
jgi:ADP-heptose:LPS heptosyltransferase